jgi:hypothetical protein
MRWYGRHYTSCINGISGTAALWNSVRAPIGSLVMRPTVKRKYFIGRNSPESPLSSSVQRIRRFRRCGGRLSHLHSALISSLMYTQSHDSFCYACFVISNSCKPSSMAYTFEYPPSFASHCPLDIARSGVLPATYQLCHHFFLTRLKVIVKEVFTRPRAQYLMDGMFQELVQYPQPSLCSSLTNFGSSIF